MKIFGFGLVDTPSLVSVRKPPYVKDGSRNYPSCPFCNSGAGAAFSLAEGSQAIQIIIDNKGSEDSTVHFCLKHARIIANEINNLLDELGQKKS